jgi:hypothetical protein
LNIEVLMNSQQRKTLDTFTRAVAFADTNPPVLANASPGFAGQVQVLKTAIAAINTVAPDRGSGKPAKTANQRALLRHALRVGQLYPIRRVARVLERTVLGMPHLVNLPSRSSSTQSLLDAAKATARDVAPYKDQFVAKGLPVDFLDRLTAAIQALENAAAANVTARMAVAGATGQLTKAFQDGRDAVTLMDSTIRSLCNADPTLGAPTLAVWNTIVSPRGLVNRTASNVVSGTTADVESSVAETETSGTGTPDGASATGAVPTTAALPAPAAPTQSEATPVATATATGGTSA